MCAWFHAQLDVALAALNPVLLLYLSIYLPEQTADVEQFLIGTMRRCPSARCEYLYLEAKAPRNKSFFVIHAPDCWHCAVDARYVFRRPFDQSGWTVLAVQDRSLALWLYRSICHVLEGRPSRASLCFKPAWACETDERNRPFSKLSTSISI